MGWEALEKQAWARLFETRDSLAPEARIEVQSDVFEWRALDHVVRHTHADLLVVGSGHDAGDGRVRLGRHAGELQERLERPLAVAPRGMRDREDARLERIGVGFDGEPESQAAVGLAGSIATAAGAELVVRGVAAERPQASLAEDALAAARATGARSEIDVTPGHVTEALYELCRRVDLVVIGSSGSGLPGRILLGRTGHALFRDAPSPMLVAPRPAA